MQNVILEVDKQHVFDTVSIATAHSREEQSHTHKILPLTHKNTRRQTHIYILPYSSTTAEGTTTWGFM